MKVEIRFILRKKDKDFSLGYVYLSPVSSRFYSWHYLTIYNPNIEDLNRWILKSQENLG
jgi:hypothetical protein